jgi:hypothetical protein
MATGPQAGVFEDQHASLGLLGADQIARAHQIVARLIVGPAVNMGRRAGLRLHQPGQRFPQRGQIGGRHFGIEPFELRPLVTGKDHRRSSSLVRGPVARPVNGGVFFRAYALTCGEKRVGAQQEIIALY